MTVINCSTRTTEQFASIEQELSTHRSLLDVLQWAKRQPSITLPEIISEVVVQDEFTHDLVIDWKEGLVLVYDTT